MLPGDTLRRRPQEGELDLEVVGQFGLSTTRRSVVAEERRCGISAQAQASGSKTVAQPHKLGGNIARVN